MSLNLQRIMLATATAGLSLVIVGCASKTSSSSAKTASSGDLTPVWQNAGTPPSATTASSHAASPAPPPPGNTLVPTVATVGSPVSTKPAYAQYDLGWPRTFTTGISTNTLYQPQVESWTGMVLRAHAAVSMQAA